MIFALMMMLNASALERPAPLPKALAAKKMKLPAPKTRTLDNGIPVVIATNDEVPLWSVRLMWQLGEAADPAGQEGLVSSTFDMMDEGAGDLDTAAFAAKVKSLAGNVSASSGSTTSGIYASGITRNLEPTLALFADVVKNPRFDASDWERVQSRRIASLKQAAEDPQNIARVVWGQVVYGDDYIGRNPTIESTKGIGLEQIKSTYADYVGPKGARIYVGGNVDVDKVVSILNKHLGEWKNEPQKQVKSDPTPKEMKPVVYFVDKPGAAQSIIRTNVVIGKATDPAYKPFLVANQAFGRAFTARVNMNLREDKGYSYGARCFVLDTNGPSNLVCSTGVQTEVTKESLVEIKKEFDDVLGERPLTEKEISNFRGAMVYAWPGKFETTDALLDTYVDMWENGLPDDHVTSYMDGIRKVTTKQANDAFQEWVSVDSMSWIVVGDRKQVFDKLGVLGLEVVELDRSGRPLK